MLRLVRLPPAEVAAQVRAALAEADSPCHGDVASNHLYVSVHMSDQHTWSPWLDVQLEPHPLGTALRGRFGPHPHVWTLFVAMYAVWTFLGIAGLMFGGSMAMLGTLHWSLLGVPASLALLLLTWLAALTGQRLGADQRATIEAFLDLTLRTEALPDGGG